MTEQAQVGVTGVEPGDTEHAADEVGRHDHADDVGGDDRAGVGGDGRVENALVIEPGAEPSFSASELVVVGIGASAGGLEALQEMLAGLSPTSTMAFVVAQHVSADYRSMLVDLLSNRSALEVLRAEPGQVVQGGKVYICPPGFHITLGRNDDIKLDPVDEAIYTTRPSIDLFFRSLADSKGPRAIGIVLSGTGSDGTSGVGAIKDVDGFSIAQDPADAKYSGMPDSAIRSGRVDLVVPADEIGAELEAISPVADRPIREFRTGPNRDAYERILRLLKADHGVDFTLYKDKTMSRRILRRMIATKTPTIIEYATFVNEDADELAELFHDLLIGVTSFFRDRIAYDELRRLLTDYVERKEEPILRIWSAGCSTGQEPYSIAIILNEILGRRIDDWRIQIFATDVNSRAIELARQGRFSPADLSHLATDLREKYFRIVDGDYELVKRVKQLVVFSKHDVMQDPPFLRQDLVVCRNVLIYLSSELQDVLLPTFHYVLHPGALLFLGQAEAVNPHQTLWEPVSGAAKLFKALPTMHRKVPQLIRSTSDAKSGVRRTTPRVPTQPKRQLEEELDRVIASAIDRMLAPHVIVIDSDERVLYSHGEANLLLRRRPGLSSDQVFDNLHPDMTVDLRTALHQVRAGDEVVVTDFRHIDVGREQYWARLLVADAPSGTMGDLVVVYCQVEVTLGTAYLSYDPDSGAPPVLVEQERQVAKLREQLAIVMEQLDNSNEEMQSLNEELQSSNEELQSSNEELETTNEELQSTNEELQTAYAELRIAFDAKAEQEIELERQSGALTEANELLMAAETIGQTGSWRWRSGDKALTWSAGLHHLLGTDGDHLAPSFEKLLSAVATSAERAVVEAHLEQLLRGDDPEPITFEVDRDGESRWLHMLAGVEHGELKQVVEVTGKVRDITDRRLAELSIDEQRARLRTVEEQVRIVLNESVNGIYVFDFTTGVNDFLSSSYTAILGWTAEQIDAMQGDDFIELFHPDDRERVLAHMGNVAELPLGGARTIRYRFKHVDGEWLELYSRDTVFAVDDEGRATKMLGTFFVVDDDA